MAAIVPAAGAGERLGGGLPKALRELDGQPMLLHALAALARSGCVDHIVVAAPPDQLPLFERLVSQSGCSPDACTVPGGPTRRASVAAALAAVPAAADIVLVHDAARPLAPASLVEAVVLAVRAGAPAVVPAVPLVDTVRQVNPDGTVAATPPRQLLRAVQTPQGFRREVLESAHRDAAAEVTDDAALVEAVGVGVRLIPGDPEAFKVTGRLDLLLAEAVLARRGRAGVR